MKKGLITYCNLCGKEIEIQGEIPKGEGLHVEKNWGYFSEKDGEIHRFDLCEECYDHLTEEFVLPVEREEQTVLI